jgi:hypothetical protein
MAPSPSAVAVECIARRIVGTNYCRSGDALQRAGLPVEVLSRMRGTASISCPACFNRNPQLLERMGPHGT